MKILVVEDKELHCQSAKDTLVGHDITIVKSFDEAMDIIPQTQWDAVLTDMMMPVCERKLVPEAFKPGEQVPYGFIIALSAAFYGAKFVAMVTDTNHHNSPMSAAIDYFGPNYYEWKHDSAWPEGCDKPITFWVNGAKVVFVHAPFTQKITKDVPCDRCEENPGECSNCNGTGLNNNPDWKPRECHRCSNTKTVGKCTQCKGDGRYDRTDTLDTKDWGQVFADLTA